MTSGMISKLIESRVRNGYSRFATEELIIDLLITQRDASSLADALVTNNFATEDEAILAVNA